MSDIGWSGMKMYLWILLCTSIWLATSARSEDHKPCIIGYSGIVTNLTFVPNPPRLSAVIRLLVELQFTREVDVITVKGFLVNEKTGFRFPFMGLLCEWYPTFCPAYKGDTRKIDWSRYFGLVWEPNVPSSIEARVLDEYDEIIGRVWTKNCTIVEK